LTITAELASSFARLLSAAGSAELAEAAHVLAQAGLKVFPLRPGGKSPWTEHGFHDASSQLATVDAWWRQMPEANIGLATGTGVSVLDVDRHGGRTGYPTLSLLQAAGLTRGWMTAVRTPSGGLHLYFPSGETEQRKWSRPAAQIDFLGLGGYVVAPPSRVQLAGGSRGSYKVIAHAGDGVPVDAIAIRELLSPPPRVTRVASGDSERPVSVARLAGWVSRLPEGSRNSGLFWAGCRLAEAGIDGTEMLIDAAIRSGLDVKEAAATIASAYRTAQHSGRSPEAFRSEAPRVMGR